MAASAVVIEKGRAATSVCSRKTFTLRATIGVWPSARSPQMFVNFRKPLQYGGSYGALGTRIVRTVSFVLSVIIVSTSAIAGR